MGKGFDIDKVFPLLLLKSRRNYELPKDCGVNSEEMMQSGKLENKVDTIFVKYVDCRL